MSFENIPTDFQKIIYFLNTSISELSDNLFSPLFVSGLYYLADSYYYIKINTTKIHQKLRHIVFFAIYILLTFVVKSDDNCFN